MSEYWIVVSIVILSNIHTVEVAINPSCECVVYQSYGLSQGTFHSPDYPSIYARGINCILFTFIGDTHEIVEITFIEMDLKPRSYNRCGDYLRLFLNLDGPEVNEHNKHDHELCGNITDLPQKTYYSKGRPLFIEFHSDEYPANFTGFKGRYRFIDRNNFKTTGIRKDGFACSWDFHSYNNDTRGKFFSPLYPQNYPSLSSCSYTFFGQTNERVKIVFLNIQLQLGNGSSSCSTDYIVIYDGLNSSSPLKRRLCGLLNNEMIASNASYLYMEFHSDERFQGKGFGATYQFIPKNSIIDYPTTTPSEFTYNVTTCNRRIQHISQNPRTLNGTMESPNFGSMYPTSIECTYEFIGQSRDRIQIKFTEFNLLYKGGSCKTRDKCSGQDSVSIYVDQINRNRVKDTFCGCVLPPWYMSNSPWMKVTFNAVSRQQDRSITGFSFQYIFRQDYGITTGIQDPGKDCFFFYPAKLGRSGNFTSANYPGVYPSTMCTYEFQGEKDDRIKITLYNFDVGSGRYYSNVTRNGTFISPNHPWTYPKKVSCNYVFIGQSKERVKIYFDPFDVEGIRPSCEDDDESDYVIYSNFRGAGDKSMRRLCGQLSPSKTFQKSDGAYFRVEFRSNEIFEGKGFRGFYEFVKDVSAQTTREPRAASASSTSSTLHVFSQNNLIVSILLIPLIVLL